MPPKTISFDQTPKPANIPFNLSPQPEPMDILDGFNHVEQPGLFQSLVQGAAQPFARVGVTGAKIAQGIGSLATGGAIPAPTQEPVDLGYFGKAAPLGATDQGEKLGLGGELLDAIGVGAEIGSWLLGGGAVKTGAKAVAETGLKAGVKRTLGSVMKEGAKIGAKIGGLAGFGMSLQEQAPEERLGVARTAIDTLVGAGLGSATGFIAPAALRPFGVAAEAVQKVPRLLGFTSDTPAGALQRHFANPGLSATQAKAPLEVVSTVRRGVIGLRTSLSDAYESGKLALVEKFTGQRVNFGSKLSRQLDDLADDFGLERIPQNPSSVSFKEAMDLYREVNALYSSPAGKTSPKFAAVRGARNDLRSLIVETFDGEGGAVDVFLRNYADEAKAIGAIDDIVKTLRAGKPTTDATAANRLMSVFDENREAYLNAIVDFENRTGINVLDDIARIKTQKLLPDNAVRVAGGPLVPRQDSLVIQLIRLLGLPFTSPKGAAWLSEVAGRAGRGLEHLDEAERRLIQNGVKAFQRLLQDRTGAINLGAEIGPKAASRLGAADDPLLAEARKYATPEEFVRKGRTFYHATTDASAKAIEDSGFTAQIGDRSLGVANGKGVWLYQEPSAAKVFESNFKGPTKTLEVKIDGKIANAYSDYKSIRAIASDKKYIQKLRDEGYVGVSGYEGDNKVTFIFDPSAARTKSQLTSLWEKAHGK